MTQTEAADPIEAELVFGTYDDAVAAIGMKSEVAFGEAEVNWPMVKTFCSLVEDTNASYWDAEYATSTWGGLVAPPAMLLTWLVPLQWRPDGVTALPFVGPKVPLPGNSSINVSSETTYLRPVQLGETLNIMEEVTEVSPEKTTRLGTGHFVTTESTVRNARGEVLATRMNVMFRFQAAEG